MSSKFTPRDVTPEQKAEAYKALKSGVRWSTLRSVKTRLQQATEYLTKSDWRLKSPYRAGSQAIEKLMHTPWLTRSQIAVILEDLIPYLESDEGLILAEPVVLGPLAQEHAGGGYFQNEP